MDQQCSTIPVGKHWTISDVQTVHLTVCKGCEIVEFIGWYIVYLVLNAQKHWCDVGCPQVAMHHSFHLF